MEKGLRGLVIGPQGQIESVHFDPKKTPRNVAENLMRFVINSESGMAYLQETETGETAFIPFSGEELDSAKHAPVYAKDEFISRAWGDIQEAVEVRIYPRQGNPSIISS